MPAEKIYNCIRDWYIETEGEDFLALSKKEQDILIWGKMQEYLDKLKEGEA